MICFDYYWFDPEILAPTQSYCCLNIRHSRFRPKVKCFHPKLTCMKYNQDANDFTLYLLTKQNPENVSNKSKLALQVSFIQSQKHKRDLM